MSRNPDVDILMATYNGEKYIKDQIESLLAQTYQKWKLLVRDDGSQDRTKEIISDYQRNYPQKVKIIEDTKGNLGPGLTFSVLLAHSNAPYAMFCDQDDVWLPQKIEITLSKMHEIEEGAGHDKPLLVFTDAKVVDERLTLISDSFWDHFKKNKRHTAVNYLLMENATLGCTLMMNDKLKSLSNHMPSSEGMHDWWITMNASIFGCIAYVETPTLLYRLHEENYSTRTIKKGIPGTFEKIRDFPSAFQRAQASIKQRQRRATAFYHAYKNSEYSNTNWLQLIRQYSEFDKMNILERKCFLLENKVFCGNVIKTIKEILLH